MIDYARQNMCDYYVPTAQNTSAPLDAFSVLKKGNPNFTYGNLFDTNIYNMCTDPEGEAAYYYENFINFREYRYDADDWKTKVVDEWNCDDSFTWVYDTVLSYGYSELDYPFHNFRLQGHELKQKRRGELIEMMAHPHVDPEISARIANLIYDKLQYRLSEEMRSQQSVLRYASYDQNHEQTILTDLSYTCTDRNRAHYNSEYKANDISLMNADSSDDHEEVFSTEAASPAGSFGSDGSKSGDEDDKKKPFRRPPGRPKGSIKKDKRPRSVSVPQFLRDLLLDKNYCPTIIKWEDYVQGKFR